ncbi:MAG: hypothetical protein WCH05_06505 [Chlorobiaceae bacterium]
MRKTHLTETLQQAMTTKGICKKDIILAYGHKNVNKAYRVLNGVLGNAVYSETILRHGLMKTIIELLELNEEIIRAAINLDLLDYNNAAEAYQRSIFKPLIYAETKETMPSSITMFGLSNGMRRWKTIELPVKIASWPEKQQLEIIRQEIKDHYLRQDGGVPFFGRITGYRYCKTYDTSYLFTPDGELIDGKQEGFIIPIASVYLG